MAKKPSSSTVYQQPSRELSGESILGAVFINSTNGSDDAVSIAIDQVNSEEGEEQSQQLQDGNYYTQTN